MIAIASLLPIKEALTVSVCALLLLSSGGEVDNVDVAKKPVARDVIPSGVDLWTTPADGRTYSDFSEDPIPADFFCPGSKPFMGRVALQGGGIASLPEGAIKEADTIIHRLDDAVFDSQGIAQTRIRFFALSLKSIEPVQTDCGAFDVRLHLQGDQPVTAMRIWRHSPFGGRYSARLSVIAKVRFTPVGAESDSVERVLTQGVEFAPNLGSWAREPGGNFPDHPNYALVDSDGDGEAESQLPGPTNFAPGHVFQGGQLAKVGSSSTVPGGVVLNPIDLSDCHCDPRAIDVGFDADPDSLNLDTSTCTHLHCPGGIFLEPCRCEPTRTTPIVTATGRDCSEAHNLLLTQLRELIVCRSKCGPHADTCSTSLRILQPCVGSAGSATMSGVLAYSCRVCSF